MVSPAARILLAFQKARLQRKWSYRELSERVGWGSVSTYRKLNGKQRIDLEDLDQLARVLGIDIEVAGQ